MGIVAGTTLGRVWLMATAVLLVGLAEREAGLAAALLARSPSSPSPSPPRASRTCSTTTEGKGAGMSGDGSAVDEGRRPEKSGLSTKAKVLIGLGVYLAVAILLLLIFGSDGKNEDFKPQNEFKLEPWVTIELGGDRPQHQQGGPLPGPRQRPDDLHDGLDLAADGAEAEPGPDRGRGRLRPDQEHDHRRQPRRRDGRAAGSPSSPRSSSGSGSRT